MTLESPDGQQFDVVVIGGGIYGACMAWEAVTRGLTTCLLEKADYSAATSANSMKIIHGGLRYLQKFDLARCRKSSLERRRFLKIAPHLVEPLSCAMPTYPGLSRSRLALAVGLGLNDLITFDRNQGLPAEKNIAPGRVRNQAFGHSLFHGFNTGPITGCALWQDAQAVHAERLVLAFILAAKKAGANLYNYHEVQNIENGRIHYEDLATGGQGECRATVIIDCSGPFDKFKTQFFPKIRQHYCKAVNLLVHRDYSPHALGMKTRHPGEDSRLLFFVPWQGQTLVGTWYFNCASNLQEADPTEEEKQLCIRDVQSLSPDFDDQSIQLWHAGLLPVDEGPLPPSQRLLEHGKITQRQDAGVTYIHVMGVKFTMARYMAQTCIDGLQSQFAKLRSSISGKTQLVQADPHDNLDDELSIQRWDTDYQNRLHQLYGARTQAIVQLALENNALFEFIPGTSKVSLAELEYVLQNEQVVTLNDLLIRRLTLGAMGPVEKETLEFCAENLANRHAWDKQRLKNETAAYYDVYRSSIKMS